MTFCTVTTTRASVDETLAFVNYHLNIGIDHLYLFFDDPDDPAIPVLATRRDITCIRCDREYWSEHDERCGRPVPRDKVIERQRHNATFAYGLARAAGHEWLMHIDVDELLFTSIPLTHAMAALPRAVSALQMPTMEAVPDGLHATAPYTGAAFFKVAPEWAPVSDRRTVSTNDLLRIKAAGLTYRLRQRAAWHFGARTVFVGRQFFRGHTIGKMAVRTDTEVETIDIHWVAPRKGATMRMGFLPGGRVLHFDSWNYAVWERKWRWRCDGTGRSITMGGGLERLDRIRQLFEDANQQGLEDYYRQLYLVGDRERALLLRLGLMRRIDVPREFFSRPVRSRP